jgi:fumarylpyruvate hydrolase
MDRRSMLNSGATMAVGAVAGCALPGTAQQGVKTPFNVPATYVPIVGSELMFAARLLHRPQLPRARHRDGLQPRP